MPTKFRSARSVAEPIRNRPLPDPISRMTGFVFPNSFGKSRSTNPVSRGLISLFQVVVQPHIGLVPRAIDLATLDTGLHFAARLVHVRAVIKAAELRRLLELRKVIAQGLAIEIPEAELADARRIDEIGAVAEVVERGRRRLVPAAAALVHFSGGELQTGVEAVENGRFADAAVTDQRGRLALQFMLQRIEALAGSRRAADDRDAE